MWPEMRHHQGGSVTMRDLPGFVPVRSYISAVSSKMSP
jgi:hypothetical protein